MDLPLYLNAGTGYDPISGMSFPPEILDELLRNQITGTQFNSQQCGEHQPARMSHGISFPAEPSSDQTNIDVQTTRTPRMTKEQQAARKKETDRIYRAKKKQKVEELQRELETVRDEHKKLKEEHNETLQSKAELNQKMDELKSNYDELESKYDELKSNYDKLKSLNEKAFGQILSLQLLQKDKDFKTLIKEGYIHDNKPTQDPSPSEEEISAVNLDGGDSEDETDSKRKKKGVACSVPRERHSGKVPKFADRKELMEMQQVSLAAKKEWYDTGAESNPTTKVDFYSITECLRILNSTGVIPYSIVKKATAKFKSSADERETFVGLTEDWRRDWVKDLENDA